MEIAPKLYHYKRIVQAKLFIDAHFADDIDLDAIADAACFSKFHFIRLFRVTYGKTPHQYLTSVRINYAKQLLKSGATITETCFQLGFESPASFTALFKRYTGTAPYPFQQKEMQRALALREEPLQFIPNCFLEDKGE